MKIKNMNNFYFIGGTLDITAHELLFNGRVKGIHVATDGAYGGIKVDKEFQKLLKKISGEHFIVSLDIKVFWGSLLLAQP